MNYENYTYEELYRMVDSTNPLALALANKTEEMIDNLEDRNATLQKGLDARGKVIEKLHLKLKMAEASAEITGLETVSETLNGIVAELSDRVHELLEERNDLQERLAALLETISE